MASSASTPPWWSASRAGWGRAERPPPAWYSSGPCRLRYDGTTHDTRIRRIINGDAHEALDPDARARIRAHGARARPRAREDGHPLLARADGPARRGPGGAGQAVQRQPGRLRGQGAA